MSKTQKGAEDKLKEFKKQMDFDEISFKKEKMPFVQYANYWMYDVKFNKVKSSSFDRIESSMKCHVIPYFEFYYINDITSREIEKFIKEMFNKKVKGHGSNGQTMKWNSVKKLYDALSALMTYAFDNDVIQRNPMKTVKFPPKNNYERPKVIYYNEAQEKAITDELFRTYKNGAPVYFCPWTYIFLLNTGLREGEFLALNKIKDFDVEKRTVFVHQSMSKTIKRDKNGKPITKDGMKIYERKVQGNTKTVSGNRVIYLNDNALFAYKKMCEYKSNCEFLAVNNQGNHMTALGLTKTFQRVLNNIGFEMAGVHSLRHTFASKLFANGESIFTVSKILGHSSPQITAETYIHFIKQQDVIAIKSLPVSFDLKEIF